MSKKELFLDVSCRGWALPFGEDYLSYGEHRVLSGFTCDWELRAIGRGAIMSKSRRGVSIVSDVYCAEGEGVFDSCRRTGEKGGLGKSRFRLVENDLFSGCSSCD